MFERILKALPARRGANDAMPPNDGEDCPPLSLVMSVPHEHRESFFPRVPGVKLTYDVLSELFKNARREIRIFSPYIDATFTSLVMQSNVPIRVITTLRDRRQKALGVVERCATSRNVTVRYIHQRKNESHLYQLHAKMILADDRAGYVGSANLTDASIHYNFELGFLLRRKEVLRSLAGIFDYLYEHVGFPAKVA